MADETLNFSNIGLISRRAADEVRPVYDWLVGQGITVSPQPDLAKGLEVDAAGVPLPRMAGACDLVVVVGGDGNMLGAARVLVDSDIPVVGVNLGRVGFLSEVNPDQLDKTLLPILQGAYREQYRSLVRVRIGDFTGVALNEAVLHSGKVAQLVEYSLQIDRYAPVHLRADGIIVASPTGSTAYALSAGGPIISPATSAVLVVPMLSQSLSSRPLVLSGDTELKLASVRSRKGKCFVTLDSSEEVSVSDGDEVRVDLLPKGLRLLHALGYDPFEVYGKKLGWRT
ncbi:MAG: NAD(+)/NADH kinase [Gammaproteobacteria bacterium AqS3]|nr:NAD(+)/NADH kinase [Gammaproteobacteria bacterium AqS3]